MPRSAGPTWLSPKQKEARALTSGRSRTWQEPKRGAAPSGWRARSSAPYLGRSPSAAPVYAPPNSVSSQPSRRPPGCALRLPFDRPVSYCPRYRPSAASRSATMVRPSASSRSGWKLSVTRAWVRRVPTSASAASGGTPWLRSRSSAAARPALPAARTCRRAASWALVSGVVSEAVGGIAGAVIAAVSSGADRRGKEFPVRASCPGAWYVIAESERGLGNIRGHPSIEST